MSASEAFGEERGMNTGFLEGTDSAIVRRDEREGLLVTVWPGGPSCSVVDRRNAMSELVCGRGVVASVLVEWGWCVIGV